MRERHRSEASEVEVDDNESGKWKVESERKGETRAGTGGEDRSTTRSRAKLK